MQPDFMYKLNSLREAIGGPITLTSAYRCREFNRSIGGGPAHMVGRAVDISVHGGSALALLATAVTLGFTGVGVKQHGTGRFVHIDTLTPGEYETSPRPWIWSYK